MARARTAMTDILEILRLRHECGFSQRDVARASGCSLGTVNKVLRGAASAGLGWPLTGELGQEELQERVFGKKPEPAPDPRREAVDFGLVHTQLRQRKRLTLRQLWEAYAAAQADGHYSYSQYCHLYREWRHKRNVSMAQEQKAGENPSVDHAGQTEPVEAPGGTFEA